MSVPRMAECTTKGYYYLSQGEIVGSLKLRLGSAMAQLKMTQMDEDCGAEYIRSGPGTCGRKIATWGSPLHGDLAGPRIAKR